MAILLAASSAVLAFAAHAGVASAHAIIELNGVAAVAGATSTMTLEVQHGCLDGEEGATKAVVYYGRAFPRVAAQSLDGWTAAVKPHGQAGHKVVWTNRGAPTPFGIPVFLPMSVSWPMRPGVYGVPVKEVCPGAVVMWDQPWGPATADRPSPPLTPLAEVEVIAGPTK